MHRARFVFLAMPTADTSAAAVVDGVVWTLVSPNNRQLGRGHLGHDTYAACRDSVLELRSRQDEMKPLMLAVEASGQWTWRVELQGATVAVSSRAYLRVRECTYNLQRFLDAVPDAEIVPGTRSVRNGRSPRGETSAWAVSTIRSRPVDNRFQPINPSGPVRPLPEGRSKVGDR